MKKVNPRHGSMQVWPRKRARRIQPRIRVKNISDKGLFGFAGYKVGMTHIIGEDVHKTSLTKGQKISVPVTVIECPPLKIHSLRLYTPKDYGYAISKEFFFKSSKHATRRVKFKQSSSDLSKITPENYSYATVVFSTQPHLIGMKKTPEIFEMRFNGTVQEVIDFVKNFKDKDVHVSDILKEGQLVDAHAITKGKGVQGPVKRFGIGLKSHKSEKGRRRPGSIAGGWMAQGHMMWRVAFAGQTGFHQRTQFNIQIYKISSNPEEVNPKGDFLHYGKVKSDYILVKGSVPGPKKRLIVFTKAIRPSKIIRPLPVNQKISLKSQQ